MSKSEQPADMGNPTSDLPYAIRVYAQARKDDIKLNREMVDQDKIEEALLPPFGSPGPGRAVAVAALNKRHRDRRDLKDMAQTCVEAEVAKIAESLLPYCLGILKSDQPTRWATKWAFQAAEEFIDERDRRALAIRAANVDSLLEQSE